MNLIPVANTPPSVIAISIARLVLVVLGQWEADMVGSTLIIH